MVLLTAKFVAEAMNTTLTIRYISINGHKRKYGLVAIRAVSDEEQAGAADVPVRHIGASNNVSSFSLARQNYNGANS